MKANFHTKTFNFLSGMIALVVLISITSCQETKKSYNKDTERLAPPTKLIDKFSYMVGHAMGSNFERDSIYDVNYDYVIQAIKDVLAKRELLISRAGLDSVNQQMQEIINTRNKNRLMREKIIVQNTQKESFEFLEKNKNNPGVVTISSGLQYKIIRNGSGDSPKVGDYAKVKARTTFLDGKELEISKKEKGEIFVQIKEGLLGAWIEALQLMKKGSKWTLWSPAELAFGDKGTEEIPPFKLIVFELELLDFQTKPYPNMPKLPETPKQ